MTDIVEASVRSRMMAGIRGSNTRPEIVIRHELHRYGFRYRLHSSGLPGKPDIVLRRHKAVILVNGCFWHGHKCHLFRWPSSRADFWQKKITRNQKRDVEVKNALSAAGWRVLVIWECAIKGRRKRPIEEVVKTAVTWIRKGKESREIEGLSDAGC